MKSVYTPSSVVPVIWTAQERALIVAHMARIISDRKLDVDNAPFAPIFYQAQSEAKLPHERMRAGPPKTVELRDAFKAEIKAILNTPAPQPTPEPAITHATKHAPGPVTIIRPVLSLDKHLANMRAQKSTSAEPTLAPVAVAPVAAPLAAQIAPEPMPAAIKIKGKPGPKPGNAHRGGAPKKDPAKKFKAIIKNMGDKISSAEDAAAFFNRTCSQVYWTAQEKIAVSIMMGKIMARGVLTGRAFCFSRAFVCAQELAGLPIERRRESMNTAYDRKAMMTIAKQQKNDPGLRISEAAWRSSVVGTAKFIKEANTTLNERVLELEKLLAASKASESRALAKLDDAISQAAAIMAQRDELSTKLATLTSLFGPHAAAAFANGAAA